ncbi:MAG TPA: DUF3558 family protein [Vicinamibacterales bacterium]|nr:DUF3558 family protein [Vicinamibacterales bacterium]
MRSARVGSAAAVALVLGLWGCGGGDPSDRPSASSGGARADRQDELTEMDACALLTVEEIEAATGHAPGKGEDPVKEVESAAPMCTWPSADGKVPQVVQLLISWSGATDYESYRDAMVKEGVANLRKVDGAGRFAVLLEDMNLVQAFGERYMVQTMVSAGDGKDPVEGAVALARAAMDRLE